MDKHYSDKTFLARWISGDLTQEEIELFKKSKDYSTFKKINDVSQTLAGPDYNREQLFQKLLSKRNTASLEKPKAVKLIPNWAYSAAASVVILLGVFYVMTSSSHFETEFSQQLAVTLPDNSEVRLNANSELDFTTFKWNKNREVTLNGEAFFDVEKGESFKVITSEGTIEVLGTEFNVIARNNYFQVQCHEGKVKVVFNASNKEAVLLPGDAIRFVNNNSEIWSFDELKPDWLHGESSFKNTPISQVITALENQFGIDFDASNVDLNKRFTGSFSHKDLNLALKTVFAPMEISYSANIDNTKIVLDSKTKFK